jgi:PAS domain S-box-containing protein
VRQEVHKSTTYLNRALGKLHGYESPAQLMAEVHNVAEQLFVDPTRMIDLAKVAAKDGAVLGAELEVYCKDRSKTVVKRWARVNLGAERDLYGDIGHYEGTVEDTTERKAAEERVQFLAYYDALTELPHRALLQDRLGNALADARRRDERVALLFLDLDRFKIRQRLFWAFLRGRFAESCSQAAEGMHAGTGCRSSDVLCKGGRAQPRPVLYQ